MAICRSCGTDVKGESKYCPDCEEKLRDRLKAMETELETEELRRRQEAEKARLEEERKKAEEERIKEENKRQAAEKAAAARKESATHSETPDEEAPVKGSSKGDRSSGRPSGRRGRSETSRDVSGEPIDKKDIPEDAEAEEDAQPWKSDIVLARFFAGMIDIALVVLPFFFLGHIFAILGWAWAISYLLLKDCLFDGSSPGKEVLRLKVVRSKSGEFISIENSFVRNIPLAMGPAIMGLGRLLVSLDIPLIPDPFRTLGAGLMLLGAVVTAAFWLLESYWLKSDANHRRFGDKIARTTVTWAEDSQSPNYDAEEGKGADDQQ